MFDFNNRATPAVSANPSSSVRGNALIVDGKPVSVATCVKALMRDVYDDGQPTGDMYQGGVSIRIAVADASGQYQGLLPKINALFINTVGNDGIEVCSQLATQAIGGKDVTSTDYGFKFMIGVYDPKTGAVVSQYDDRPKVEYTDNAEESSPFMAKYLAGTQAPKTERDPKYVGFINIYAYSAKEQKYFRIGKNSLLAADVPYIAALRKMEADGCVFAPVVTPTNQLQQWLDASAKPVTEEPSDALSVLGDLTNQ